MYKLIITNKDIETTNILNINFMRGIKKHTILKIDVSLSTNIRLNNINSLKNQEAEFYINEVIVLKGFITLINFNSQNSFISLTIESAFIDLMDSNINYQRLNETGSITDINDVIFNQLEINQSHLRIITDAYKKLGRPNPLPLSLLAPKWAYIQVMLDNNLAIWYEETGILQIELHIDNKHERETFELDKKVITNFTYNYNGRFYFDNYAGVLNSTDTANVKLDTPTYTPDEVNDYTTRFRSKNILYSLKNVVYDFNKQQAFSKYLWSQALLNLEVINISYTLPIEKFDISIINCIYKEVILPSYNLIPSNFRGEGLLINKMQMMMDKDKSLTINLSLIDKGAFKF